MRVTVFICLLGILSLVSIAQQTNTKSFYFEGQIRSYIEYLPANYDASKKVPLLLSLHGMGDNAANFQNNGLKLIADTAGFIIVYPNAAVNTNPSINKTFWNTDLDTSYHTNDVGFLSNLIDTLKNNYNIDNERVFCSGFSSGGFMTQRLACEKADIIKGIVPIAGTIATTYISSCNPSNPVPIMHIHGTTDNVVPWNGNASLNEESVDNTIAKWISINGCTTTDTTHKNIDNSANDGYNFERYTYNNCTGAEVQLLKGNNVGHTWIYKPLNDIDYSVETWKFLMKVNSSSTFISNGKNIDYDINIYPNPANSYFTVDLINDLPKNIQLYDLKGTIVFQKMNCTQQMLTINTDEYKPGIYFLRVTTYNDLFIKKLILSE